MLRLIVVLLALVGASTAAFAASKWNGAGWYQIADAFESAEIIAGPFSDKDACNATLPANDQDFDYYCNYLDARPSWDK